MDTANFPKQMVSDSVKKTKRWQEDSIDAAIAMAINSSNSQLTMRDININYDLYNNKLNMNDVLKSINKDGILGQSFPDEIENHHIMSPKISLLVGESIKSRFDWNVAVSSPNVITEKDRKIRQIVMERLTELSNPEATPDLTKEDIEAEIKKLSRWKKYGYRDIRELTVTNLINYYYTEQNLDTKFSQGITNAIISNREFYDVGIYDGKIIVEAIDPRTLYYVLGPGRTDIEDADILVHTTYQTPGHIIDRLYDKLTTTEMQNIESATTNPKKMGSPSFRYTPTVNFSAEIVDYERLGNNGVDINSNGEIRVDKVMWKSRRKVGKLTFINEDEEEDVRLVPEQYKPNVDLGEEVEWFWINEWWESIKILDMYIGTAPRQIQFRGADNISIANPGIVGTIYPGDPIVSKAKPYQYLYNIISFKVQKLIAKYKGPMIELDFSKVPEGWDMTRWLKVGDETGFLPIDSFKEGNKGAATGRLAGSFNTSGKEYAQHAGSYFNDMFGMLSHINEEMGAIIGVSKQREGAIGNRETVGGVEHAVTQSSHISEELFHFHDYTKLKVLKAIVENAKWLYKNGKSKVIQYLVDESSIASFKVDGELINESDYAIMISNSQNITELINSFKQLAPEGMRAGKFNFSNVMDIYLSKSLAETRRTIEDFEASAEEAERKRSEEASKQAEAARIAAKEIRDKEDELKRYEIDKDNETKIIIQDKKDAVELKKIEASEDDETDEFSF